MFLTTGVQAGKVSSQYVTGYDALMLDNITIKLVNAETREILDGNIFTFDLDGSYTLNPATPAFGDGYSFVSEIYKDSNKLPAELMARLGSKDWPIGEPAGVKAVNDDAAVRAGDPVNCLMATSYLNGLGLNVPVDERRPTQCSSQFQSHKRFKISMLPATVAGVADGSLGKPIELTFKVANDATTRAYQVFSKINNYTGKRLSGFKLEVGRYDGGVFKTAKELGIEDKLFISLGMGEGATGAGTYDGRNLFDPDDLATFSFGLFGDADTNENFDIDGFFDDARAGFNVEQICSETGTLNGCGSMPFSEFPATTSYFTDVIQSTTALPCYYQTYFGDWLPLELVPKGIFWDDDNNESTDPILVAVWDGGKWVRGNADLFAEVPADVLNAWAADPLYFVDIIEDMMNLSLNYIVKVGDDIGGDFVIRVTPRVAADQAQPAPWLTDAPAVGDLEPVSGDDDTDTDTGGGGGGCAIGGDARFDPVLPALLAMGLGLFAWRRFKPGK